MYEHKSCFFLTCIHTTTACSSQPLAINHYLHASILNRIWKNLWRTEDHHQGQPLKDYYVLKVHVNSHDDKLFNRETVYDWGNQIIVIIFFWTYFVLIIFHNFSKKTSDVAQNLYDGTGNKLLSLSYHIESSFVCARFRNYRNNICKLIWLIPSSVCPLKETWPRILEL